MSQQEIINQMVSEACISLFSDYALALQPRAANAPESEVPLLYCGVVGFSGEEMRGTLLLGTSREPLGRTSPASDASLREWIAELSNQMLGRIKNKLLTRGVNMHLSTPIVLRGEHIAPVGRAELVPLAFTCDGGLVCVWLDYELKADIDLSQIVELEGAVLEGSGTLF
jgi:CheY-specific phosphatase CheX